MKNIFNTKKKVLIGLAAIVVSVVIGIVTGFSYDSNGIMSVFMVLGVISLINILISKIYKTDVSYGLYMAGNIIGISLALFVISMSESIGNMYMILFLIVIFLAMWVYEIYLINVEGLLKRIIGAFVANIIVTASSAIAVLIVITVSVIITMTS